MKRKMLLAIFTVAMIVVLTFAGCNSTPSEKEGGLEELLTVAFPYARFEEVLSDETLRSTYATIKPMGEEPNPNISTIKIDNYTGTDEFGQPFTFSSYSLYKKIDETWCSVESTMHYNDITVSQSYKATMTEPTQYNDDVYVYVINGERYRFDKELFEGSL